MRYIEDVANGLRHLHGSGLVHGDFNLKKVLYKEKFVIKGFDPSKIEIFPDSTSDEKFMGSTSTLK